MTGAAPRIVPGPSLRERRSTSPTIGVYVNVNEVVYMAYPGGMLRVSDEIRDRVLRVGQEEFGGASADETVRRLLDEHWQAKAIAAVQRYRDADPQGWADYIAEADELADADARVSDEWVGNSR